MKTPPPVHVHVTDATPVHVHMRRRSPGGDAQEARVPGGGGRRGRAPWIPPGRSSTRRDLQPAQRGARGDAGQSAPPDQDDFSQDLTVLLKEQDNERRARSLDLSETQVLLRALVEADVDGVAVAGQLVALKEAVDELRKEKRLTKVQAAALERQRQALVEKIQMFHHTNRGLRELLRGQTQHQRVTLAWAEENQALKARLTDFEAQNMRLEAKLSSRDKQVGALTQHLDLEKDNVRTSQELSRLLQSSQERLETQLTRAEADKVRLQAQVQDLQQKLQQQQQLQERLKSQRAEEEQENQEAEETRRQLRVRLQEKEAQLVQARSQSSDWSARHSREAAARQKVQDQAAALRLQVSELSHRLQQDQETRRAEREEVSRLTTDVCHLQTLNQSLQDQVSSGEEKLRRLRSEASELRSNVRRKQNLLDTYKKKLQQVRTQSEDFHLRLEQTQKEARLEKLRLETEKEQLRTDLSARLHQLEALPDQLRRTEEQLREAQQEAEDHRRRNQEHGCGLARVRHKVEQQGAELDQAQRRSTLLQEEKKLLQDKTQHMERKLEELTLHNRLMSQTLDHRDADARSVQQQLEDKSLEVDVLSRQLQQALDHAHRQVDESARRVLSKENLSHSRALDLQGQLGRARTELSQVQRSKEELERRLQNQVQDLRERLEQSDCTNRSLSSYVHFLKSSCAPLVT